SAIRAARRPSARVSSPPGRSLPIPASTRQLPSVAPAIWSSVAPAFLGVAAYFSSTATSLTAIDREGTGTSITCQPKVSAKSNNICLTLSSRGGRGLPVPLPLRSDVPGSGVQGVLDHGACPEQHRHDVVPEQHLRYLRARTCQGAAGKGIDGLGRARGGQLGANPPGRGLIHIRTADIGADPGPHLTSAGVQQQRGHLAFAKVR